jgi:toxin ParE1/3/4
LTVRLSAGAETDIHALLDESERIWGIDAARRYLALIDAAIDHLDRFPDTPGVSRVAGARLFPLRLARRLVPREQRVGTPRHVVVFRVAGDGAVEILGFIHDRMSLPRTARRVSERP